MDKCLLSILLEIPLHQVGRETVEARLYWSVGGEKIAGTSDGQSEIEWLLVIRHVGASSLQHRECSMAFVEMAHFGLQSEGAKELPSSNAKYHFLFQT